MKVRAFLLPLLLCFATANGSLQAATYYLDSNNGNDSYAGTASLPGAGNTGPWQTLGRLAAGPLKPGDTVYLTCGSRWSETLTLPASGNSGAPILVAAGPGSCGVPPVIDGSVPLPAHVWSRYGNSNVYRAKLPIELIANSGLHTNLVGWSAYSSAGPVSIALDTACTGSPLPCMALTSASGSGTSIAISHPFEIQGGARYAASAQVKAPAGHRIKIAVRRAGPTYEPLAAEQFVTSSGSWQSIAFPFTATKSVGAARLDIEVPNGGLKVNIQEAHVNRVLSAEPVAMVFVEGSAVRRAHHPNFGRSEAGPHSVFETIATTTGKTTLDARNLRLPENGTLTAGLNVSIRTQTFALEERKVSAVAGTQLTLDQSTFYTIQGGYGFFLTGALWMLDTPGEWFYDASTSSLYVWMPDSQAPGARVSISQLATGVDLRARSHIELLGFNIARASTGAALSSTSSVRLRYMTFAQLEGHGIHADNSTDCSVLNSSISRTGLDAVRAVGALTTRFTLADSRVAESGASERTDGWRVLPRPARAAVNVGPNATIARNQIVIAANNGMYLGTNTLVDSNHVTKACANYNDCGGIYTSSIGSNSIIERNVVEHIIGSTIGLPALSPNQAVGVYLDDWSSDVLVRGNTISHAEYGIHVHNTSASSIVDNLIYGNRRYQIWFQEQTKKLRSNGDIHGNHVDSNTLVPVGAGPSIFLESEVGDTTDFATFVNNHYSGLLSPRPISESSPGSSKSYTLQEWQAKGHDTAGRITQPAGYASFLTNGFNVVPNGNLANGHAGWAFWNQTAPAATMQAQTCAVVGSCIKLTAGGSPSLLSSPNFSVDANQWYRVTFDAATSTPDQPINALVRRGGGGTATYEALMPSAESFSGSTSWRRYSFIFRASKTVIANDPVTKELGARVDFERVQPGTALYVSRLEMLKLSPAEAAMQLRLLLNPKLVAETLACEQADAAASLCGKFVYLKTDADVTWPALVPPLGGHALYSRDTSLVDSDGDGVANVQDACPGTPLGNAVNSRGCALGQ